MQIVLAAFTNSRARFGLPFFASPQDLLASPKMAWGGGKKVLRAIKFCLPLDKFQRPPLCVHPFQYDMYEDQFFFGGGQTFTKLFDDVQITLNKRSCNVRINVSQTFKKRYFENAFFLQNKKKDAKSNGFLSKYFFFQIFDKMGASWAKIFEISINDKKLFYIHCEILSNIVKIKGR